LRQEVPSDVGSRGFYASVRDAHANVAWLCGLLPLLAYLDLDVSRAYPEVAAIAYNFHWSRAECMAMGRKEREIWLGEISKINKQITKRSRVRKK